ncbi:6-O-methylguanine DNA methyltransferase, DNA binding domain protein [Mycobacterium xenopi 4042]|uniref:6-O-methylguanine DNA methyltransferase, DNA binding domain protein n=1 Tax=Mycobacterium xenopi 4042 TaxID=1299334 RepID=X8E472_MYCXE|nr:6-O-methylguanine DNA methyltransferase, DNA binding domain protein [Mycobacterium xenopi 4042]
MHETRDGSVEQLEACFAGQRTTFDLQLELRGSQFQRQVWEALLTIPYGETRSHGEIAEQIGAPGAAELSDLLMEETLSQLSCRATG